VQDDLALPLVDGGGPAAASANPVDDDVAAVSDRTSGKGDTGRDAGLRIEIHEAHSRTTTDVYVVCLVDAHARRARVLDV